MSNGRIIEVKNYADIYFIDLTKEKNKCIINEITEKYGCLLNTIVECLEESVEDCTFNLNYDHNKESKNMKPKQIFTNVISESEEDLYKITITDPNIKNFVIVLMQNTRQTMLRYDFYIIERNTHDLNEEKQNNNFLPNLI